MLDKVINCLTDRDVRWDWVHFIISRQKLKKVECKYQQSRGSIRLSAVDKIRQRKWAVTHFHHRIVDVSVV